MKTLVSAFIALQIALAPATVLAAQKLPPGGGSSGSRDSRSPKKAPGTKDTYTTMMPVIPDGQTDVVFLPVQVTTILGGADPYTGESDRLELYAGMATTPEEAAAAVRYLRDMTGAVFEGKTHEASLATLETDEDTPEENLDIDPADFKVAPERFTRIKMKMNALREFGNTLMSSITPKWAETRYDRFKDRFHNFVETLTMKNTRNPFNVIGLSKTREVSLERLTFSVARLVTVFGIVTYALVSSKDLKVAMAAAATAGALFGTMSAGLQWHKERYSEFFGEVLPILIMRKLGVPDNRVFYAVENFVRNSTVLTFANGMVNYIATEKAFLYPAAIIVALYGQSLYPKHFNFAGHEAIFDPKTGQEIVPSLLINGTQNADGAVAQAVHGVAKEITGSCLKAYATQGIIDQGTSIITEGRKSQIAAQVARGEISSEAADYELRHVNFMLGWRMVGVAMVSNLGVVMSMPSSGVMRATGDAIVYSMAAAGTFYLLYAAIRYHPTFRSLLRTTGSAIAKAPTKTVNIAKTTWATTVASIRSVGEDFRSMRNDFKCGAKVASSK